MPTPHALTPAATERLTAAGAGIAAALHAILETIPVKDRNARSLTSRFAIEGVVARRLIRAANADDPLTLLTRLPNITHLRKLAATLGDPALAESLVTATDAYEKTLAELYLSPVSLKRALRTPSE